MVFSTVVAGSGIDNLSCESIALIGYPCHPSKCPTSIIDRIEHPGNCLRGQALLQQLSLKQLDVALADVDDSTLTEFLLNLYSFADVVDDGA